MTTPRKDYGDHKPRWRETQPRYSSILTGPGRWVWVTWQGHRVGVLATDDRQALLFIGLDTLKVPASGPVGNMVTTALNGAAALNTPATEVFDAWAERTGLVLAAEGAESGSLDALVAHLNG